MGNTWLGRLFKGELGWKSVSAAVALVVLVVLQATGTLSPEEADKYVKLAEAVGLVGLRDAFSKLPK